MGTTHTCPAPSCDQQVPYHQFACKGHWFALPKALRDAINDAWFSGDTGDHAEAMMEATDWLAERYPG
jgi:hypothetical protein